MCFCWSSRQALAVGAGGEMVEDGDAAGGLLEGEVAHVRDEKDELFLMVGAAEGLGGGLDDDDASVGGGLIGERSGAVGEAIVGDEDPAAVFEVGSGGFEGGDLAGEGRHGLTVPASRDAPLMRWDCCGEGSTCTNIERATVLCRRVVESARLAVTTSVIPSCEVRCGCTGAESRVCDES